MNRIHPTAIVDRDVELGSGNTIGPYAVISGPVRLGDDNWIGAGSQIGAFPEVRDADRQVFATVGGAFGTTVFIGDRTVIREGSQVHRGWKAATTIGNEVFIMNQSYVAHDCTIADRVTMASSTLLAGHVQIDEGANLGMGSKVHQFRRIGRLAMLGMGSVVTKDIPPFAKAFGAPARVASANSVGMSRAGLDESLVLAVSAFYLDPASADPPNDLLGAAERELIATWLSARRAAGQ